MTLFRSEEHVDRWSEMTGISKGAVLTPAQGWELARRWYADRLDHGWRRKTPDEAEAVFAGIGLNGSFWRLRP